MGSRCLRVRPAQTARARQLRGGSTFPERLLWSRLRDGQLGGLKFRRQGPIGQAIVDFYCASKALVVELDGETHVGRVQADERRTRDLEVRGLRVIRFTNGEVLSGVDAVLTEIGRNAGIAF